MLLKTPSGYLTPFGTFTTDRSKARHFAQSEIDGTTLTEGYSWAPRFLPRLGLYKQVLDYINVLLPDHDPEEEFNWLMSLERAKELTGENAVAYALLYTGLEKTSQFHCQSWLDKQESDESIEAYLKEKFGMRYFMVVMNDNMFEEAKEKVGPMAADATDADVIKALIEFHNLAVVEVTEK